MLKEKLLRFLEERNAKHLFINNLTDARSDLEGFVDMLDTYNVWHIAIGLGFNWKCTPEGIDFWREISAEWSDYYKTPPVFE